MGRIENAVQRACLELLILAGAFVWRNNTGAGKVNGKGGASRFIRFGFKGSGDLLGLLPGGRFISVETKGNAVQSEEQKGFQREVERLGGVYVLAYHSEDLEIKLRTLGLLGGVAIGSPCESPTPTRPPPSAITAGPCVTRRRGASSLGTVGRRSRSR